MDSSKSLSCSCDISSPIPIVPRCGLSCFQPPPSAPPEATPFVATALHGLNKSVGFHLSAQVLSGLFIPQGKLREVLPVHQLSANVNPLDTARHPAASELRTEIWLQGLNSASLLEMRVRIHSADFPYQLFTVVQRLQTLESRCGCGYDQGYK